MSEAIKAVQNGDLGWLAASKRYGVPQATLRRRAQDKNKRIKGSQKGLGRYGPTFSAELEREIVQHIKKLETCMFGLNTTEVRQLAFELPERKKLPHRFNRIKKKAGGDWLVGFRGRNPDISLRTPEATSAARAQGFNKPQVEKFFNLLEHTVAEHKTVSTMLTNLRFLRFNVRKKLWPQREESRLVPLQVCRTGGTHFCSLCYESNR
ncbi:uncharacterized protein LOC126750337 [Anthonomus grandis grandis]|uniref:uncharacterized protein LOC126750337 n=1 Tax=Anthonomus grandis grandis TaxID=2921223 RepID=UPI0021659E14|nr:uncharacterized protein LOC126750337 [Anthonomus grandis grandis]